MATKAAPMDAARVGSRAYEEYVNPQWVALLNLLDMNVEYERCMGCELFTRDGRRILDFLSGIAFTTWVTTTQLSWKH